MSMRHELIVATMDRLRFGVVARSKMSFGPALRNKFGCLLPQKKENKKGYNQIRPSITNIKVADDGIVLRPHQQYVHRLALLEIGDRMAPVVNRVMPSQKRGPGRGRWRISRACTIRKVMRKGLDISHLCHHNNCINTDHMVFESKTDNNRRNMCRGREECRCGREPPCLVGAYGERVRK